MLKILLRLWWVQHRRNFTWKDVLIGAYIILLYAVVGGGVYLGFTGEGGETFDEEMPDIFGAILVVGLMGPDMISKLVMKRDATAMDDYVKARPIPARTWNHFLALTNLISFWNYAVPLLMLPMLFWMLSASQAVASFLLLLLFSYTNGLFITCYRKSKEFMLKWPLVLGWLGLLIVTIGYLMVFSWMSGWVLYLGMAALAILSMGGLLIYLYNLNDYNEDKHKVTHHRSFGKTTLYGLQYIGLMRAKRVRNMVLMMVIIFFLDSLLMAFIPETEGEGMNQGQVILYVVGDVLLPSVVLSQWTFGIEANYFQGLMTKPVKVENLLRNCYYFYLSISGVMAVLAICFIFINEEITVFSLIGAFAMAVVINLSNLPTCLFSSRLEIFSGAMFNMQGANTKINLYGFVFAIPTALLAGVYYLWGEMTWCITSVVLAAIALAIHRPVIAKLAAIFERKKYQRIEKFMES